MKELWWSKYRPVTVDDYVFNNPTQREQILKWIENKSIPNLILHGSSGLGKSALANLLVRQLGVDERDILKANGSKEGRRIGWVDELVPWCATMPFGDFKVVIIEEADYAGLHTVQPALRDLIDENANDVRFILTCNYPHKISQYLHSRCTVLKFEKMDINEFTARTATILLSENITFTVEVLDQYVTACYPDMRHCLNELENHSLSGTLSDFNGTSSNDDILIKIADMFKAGKIREARSYVCENINPADLGEIYTWLYHNIELLGDTQHKQDNAVMIIKQACVDHTIIGDPEINFADCMIRLAHNFNN